jgi:hypothetical protein
VFRDVSSDRPQVLHDRFSFLRTEFVIGIEILVLRGQMLQPPQYVALLAGIDASDYSWQVRRHKSRSADEPE